MMRRFRILISSVFSIIILLCMLNLEVDALSVKHKHQYTNDVCKKCGDIRLHSFDFPIPVYTRKANVPIWEQPTKNSTKIREIENEDTYFEVDAVMRNQYNNIWLKLSSQNEYVYLDNIYLDFDKLVLQNYQQIVGMESDETRIIEFYNFVKPGGKADYKKWLDPSSRGIQYNVKIGTDFYQMTAEELGNIHYGFLGKAAGFEDDILLYAGGGLNVAQRIAGVPGNVIKTCNDELTPGVIWGNWRYMPICLRVEFTKKSIDTIMDIYSDCSKSYCDAEDDAENVARGILYYDTGEFV